MHGIDDRRNARNTRIDPVTGERIAKQMPAKPLRAVDHAKIMARMDELNSMLSDIPHRELNDQTHIDISMWLARSAGISAELNKLMELFLEYRDPKTGQMFIEQSNAA